MKCIFEVQIDLTGIPLPYTVDEVEYHIDDEDFYAQVELEIDMDPVFSDAVNKRIKEIYPYLLPLIEKDGFNIANIRLVSPRQPGYEL